MAGMLPQSISSRIQGLGRLPAHRQFGTVLGLAVVVALGIFIMGWATQPSYRVLMPGLSERDAAQAMDLLARGGVPHRLDRNTGTLMVPANRVHEARLSLATEGLPRNSGTGFELLDQDSGLGTSRLVESARYQRALEGELARSIMTLDSVESARVHLAMPRPTAFVRERSKPGASVLVTLRPGRQLDDAQIAGILHLVASSVPELEIEQVSVLDQRGRLLSQNGNSTQSGAPVHQLDYTRRVEDIFRERVEAILAPLLGDEGMRVQVTAEVDFTQVESTQELFDPESLVVRSEQLSEEESRGALLGGVPGALTNQPPGAATVAGDGETLEAEAQPPLNINRRSTRNYEVDRTVSHIRRSPARLERLTVAVVVDHRETVGEEGQRLRVAREADEMEYLRSLVREAVGYNEARGDRVNVVNLSFREVPAPEPFPEPSLLEAPWVADLARQALAGLGLLLLVLLVLKPALKSLAQPAPLRPALAGGGELPQLPAPMAAGGNAPVPVQDAPQTLAAPQKNPDEEINRARQRVEQDPKLVAQVVRQWVNADEK